MLMLAENITYFCPHFFLHFCLYSKIGPPGLRYRLLQVADLLSLDSQYTEPRIFQADVIYLGLRQIRWGK